MMNFFKTIRKSQSLDALTAINTIQYNTKRKSGFTCKNNSDYEYSRAL